MMSQRRMIPLLTLSSASSAAERTSLLTTTTKNLQQTPEEHFDLPCRPKSETVLQIEQI